MKKEILIVGLGRMGSGIAKRLINKGYIPYLYNRDYSKTKEFLKYGCKGLRNISDFSKVKSDLKIVWLMLPAGDITNSFIKRFSEILSDGDIIVDGGNSYWRDSIKNGEFLKDRGIYFLDVGVSGGIWGEKNGYCIMVGGDKKPFKMIEEYLKAISEDESYLYCGDSGSGHFVKMVHNAIEYGIMQAYAEGFELLASFDKIKTTKKSIAQLWNKNSVIRSWLLELIVNALDKDDDLSTVIGSVDDSGEGRWAVEYALNNAIPAEIVALSLFRRFRSRKNNPFSERLLAVLREQFGGHRVLRKDERDMF